MDDLVARVARLERTNKRQRVIGFLLVLGIAGFGAKRIPDRGTDIIRASQFQLLDKKGEPVGLWIASDDGSQLFMTGTKKHHMALNVGDSGSQLLLTHGNHRVKADAADENAKNGPTGIRIAVGDDEDSTRAFLGVYSKTNAGYAFTRDENGEGDWVSVSNIK